MENLINHSKYKEARKAREEFFVEENRSEKTSCIPSPSSNFELIIESYKTKEGCWNYSRGIVRDTSSQVLIADVKRNYDHFPYLWVLHPNGKEYLVCGEDYQGYTIINVTDARVHNFVPDDWLNGTGFCWISHTFVPETQELKVEGCFWACPYEIVTYDFSDPDTVPLKEMKREDVPYEDEEDE